MSKNAHSSYKHYLINISRFREEQTKHYFKNLYYVKDKKSDAVKIEYNLKDSYRKTYLYYKGVSDYINKMAVNKGLTPIFLTLTLPSEYHIFKKNLKTNELIKNGKSIFKEDEINEAIKFGYKRLNKCFREIVRQGQRKDWQIDVMYLRVIEPHKSFAPHLHAVIFVPDSHVQKIVKVIQNKRRLYELGEQYKVEILEDKEKGSAYLLKYMQKTLLPDNPDFLYLYDGWKKAGKIRSFTHSNVGIDRNAFNKLINHFINKNINKNLQEEFEESPWINPYEVLSNNTVIFEYENESDYQLIKKNYKEFFKTFTNGKYFVVRKIRRETREKWETDYLNKKYSEALHSNVNTILDKLYTYKYMFKKFEKSGKKFDLSKWTLCGMLDTLADEVKNFIPRKIDKLKEHKLKKFYIPRNHNILFSRKYIMYKKNYQIYTSTYKEWEKLQRVVKNIALDSDAYNEVMSLYTMPFQTYNRGVFKNRYTLEAIEKMIQKIKDLKPLINKLILDIGIALYRDESIKIVERQAYFYRDGDEIIYDSEEAELIKIFD